MNKITTQILEELYTSEPSLREKDEYIQKIVAQMMDRKPEVTISENFKKVLKNRLISEMSREKEQKTVKKNRFFRIFWYTLGVGALASFAISFGLLEIVGITGIKPTTEIPKKENLALVRNMQTDSSKDDPRTITPELSKITSKETTVAQDAVKEPQTSTR